MNQKKQSKEHPNNPPDRYQEASDAALVEEHEEHPERFEQVKWP